ncbi:hypothetical protein B0H17DRAFT_1145499 [Mycena rosella]|uniref:Uncharacterized protein n=1 Tax=Mycena rosella TaxID=1033263 RepID=A0AAD7CR18_MYCRO|nr:hypothetical protein B0H17DRAFT_1145499 [Mycena rosella]
MSTSIFGAPGARSGALTLTLRVHTCAMFTKSTAPVNERACSSGRPSNVIVKGSAIECFARAVDRSRCPASTTDGPMFDSLTMLVPDILGNTVVRAVNGLQFGGWKMLGVTTAVVARMGGGFLLGMSVVFSTGASNALAEGAIVQSETAFHIAVNSEMHASVSTQIAALRNFLFSNSHSAPWSRVKSVHIICIMLRFVTEIIQGAIPLVIAVHNADIMATLLHLKAEFYAAGPASLRMMFAGATEAHTVTPACSRDWRCRHKCRARARPTVPDCLRLSPNVHHCRVREHGVNVALGVETDYDARNARLELARALGLNAADAVAEELVIYQGGRMFDLESEVLGLASERIPTQTYVDLHTLLLDQGRSVQVWQANWSSFNLFSKKLDPVGMKVGANCVVACVGPGKAQGLIKFSEKIQRPKRPCRAIFPGKPSAASASPISAVGERRKPKVSNRMNHPETEKKEGSHKPHRGSVVANSIFWSASFVHIIQLILCKCGAHTAGLQPRDLLHSEIILMLDTRGKGAHVVEARPVILGGTGFNLLQATFCDREPAQSFFSISGNRNASSRSWWWVILSTYQFVVNSSGIRREIISAHHGQAEYHERLHLVRRNSRRMGDYGFYPLDESNTFGLAEWLAPAQNGLCWAWTWILVAAQAQARPNGLQAI